MSNLTILSRSLLHLLQRNHNRYLSSYIQYITTEYPYISSIDDLCITRSLTLIT